jgi:PPM family protein phosphatase
MSGKNNEDRYAVSAFRLEGEKSVPAVFAVLCDGVGGHRGGEVAAEIAVETISQVVARSDATQPQLTLCEAIQAASQKILETAGADSNLGGMAATCACSWVIDDQLYIAYVGDSRIYLARNGTIQQLSNDHTWIQEALDAGVLTPEQARGHPNAHVIRRHLGSQQMVEPDTRLRLASDESDEQMLANQGLHLQPGDQVVLCSDGLTDLVSASEIQATLDGNEQAEALNALTSLANHRGGHDNITIVVLQVPLVAPASTLAETVPLATPVAAAAQPSRRKRSYFWAACLGSALLAAILLALVAGIMMFVARRSLDATQTPPATETASSIRTLLAVSPTVSVPQGQASPTLAPPGPTHTPGDSSSSGPPTATLTPWPTAVSAPVR